MPEPTITFEPGFRPCFGWIMPDGNFYECDYTTHSWLLTELRNTLYPDARWVNCVHVSNRHYGDTACDGGITDAQARTLLALMDAGILNQHYFCVDLLEVMFGEALKV